MINDVRAVLNRGEVNLLIQHLASAAIVNMLIAVTGVGNSCKEAEKSQRDNTKRELLLEELKYVARGIEIEIGGDVLPLCFHIMHSAH